MGDLLFLLVAAGAFSLALAAAYILFNIALFILYKFDGGRLKLAAYLKKML